MTSSSWQINSKMHWFIQLYDVIHELKIGSYTHHGHSTVLLTWESLENPSHKINKLTKRIFICHTIYWWQRHLGNDIVIIKKPTVSKAWIFDRKTASQNIQKRDKHSQWFWLCGLIKVCCSRANALDIKTR
jgi:hypothetical protein